MGTGPIELRNPNELKAIISVAFKPGYSTGRVLGVGESQIYEWTVENGTGDSMFTTVAGARICGMDASADGQWVVTGGAGGTVTIWDANTWKKALQVTEHEDHVFAIDVSNDSARFASASRDKTVRIFNIKSGVRTIPPLEHASPVYSVKFSPGGGHIATIIKQSICIHDAHTGDYLFDVDAPTIVTHVSASPLAWCSDGHHLYYGSQKTVHCIDTVTDSNTKWPLENIDEGSIFIAASGTFIVCCAGCSISFWDHTSHKQIGQTIRQSSRIRCISISRDRECLACGHDGGVTVHLLSDHLPPAYLHIPLFSRTPLMQVSDNVVESWMLGDASATEALLSDEVEESSGCDYHTLATRALVRSHLGQWRTAMEDAEKSLQIVRSPIGYVAKSVALVGTGEQDVALDDFDFAFRDSESSDNAFLLVIKSILMFLCGHRKQAVSRLYGLITAADEDAKSIYHQILGNMYLKLGDYENAVQILSLPKNHLVSPECGPLMTISLIFNWNFKDLESTAWRCLCERLHTVGSVMDVGETLLKMIGTLTEEEKDAAQGRIIQEIVTRSGQVTLLAWTGKPSALNSCLPNSPAVYRQKQAIPPPVQGEELDRRTAELQTVFTRDDALVIYGRATRLQPVRFVHFRLHLPCIVFRAKSLNKEEDVYRANVDGLGDVEFATADSLPLKEPQNLTFVNMWIPECLPAPAAGEDQIQSSKAKGNAANAVNNGAPGADTTMDNIHVSIKEEAGRTPPLGRDKYQQALELIARLGQPFNALLLLRQPDGTYKRVAADRDIIVRGTGHNLPRNVCVEVLEVV